MSDDNHSIDASVSYPPSSVPAIFPGGIVSLNKLLNQDNLEQGETIPTLAAPMGPTDTSFSVATGTGANLPPNSFMVTIDGEIILVGSVSGDTCNGCARGAENTTPTSHNAGTQVNAFITAQSHNQNAAEIAAIELSLGVNLQNVCQVVKITINPTQLSSLSLAPVTLLPAPGPGLLIVLLAAQASIKPGVKTYTLQNNGPGFGLYYDTIGIWPTHLLQNAANNPVPIFINSPPNMAGTPLKGLTANFFIYTMQNLTNVGPFPLGLMQNKAVKLYNTNPGTNLAATSFILMGQPLSLSVDQPGSGYLAGDKVSIESPQTGQGTQLLVTSVNEFGGVTGLSVISTGAGSNTINVFFPRGFMIASNVSSNGSGLYVRINSVTGSGANGIIASNITAGSAGTGYAVGDTGTVSSNANFGNTAKYVIDAVSGGVVTAYHITSVGSGFFPAGGISTTKTTGAGSGLKLDVTAVGGGYAVGDTGTISNGTYLVGSVDANGNILTVSFPIAPTSISIANTGTFTAGGSQPGIGFGGEILVTYTQPIDVSGGDGVVDIFLTYVVVPAP